MTMERPETVDDLQRLADRNKKGRQRSRPAKPAEPPPPIDLATVEATFRRWLALNDLVPVHAVLAAIAANLSPGKVVWLGVIAASSSGKTELLNSLSRVPFIHAVSSITPAAMLSGTPKREKTSASKGGLLREVGDFGILVLKDFGSILSMRPDAKAETLAMLREVYDGAVVRRVGSDGGRALPWRGRIGLIFACTQAYDEHHSVIAGLGDRFLLVRLTPSEKQQRRSLIYLTTPNRA
jgi:hypothetical protein